jgi:uncharacterized DUF497 family protein
LLANYLLTLWRITASPNPPLCWTIAHRGIDFATDAEKVFAGDTVTVVDDRFDYGEIRSISAGFLDHRMVVVVWTRRGTSRHIFDEVLP